MWYWLSGAVLVCHMFLVFLILWKGSQYLFQCHLEHIYFHFCNEKLMKYPFMLDVFDHLEINAKVCYREYQYVLTPTLTMSEFDTAFLSFICCRILSLISFHLGVLDLSLQQETKKKGRHDCNEKEKTPL